MMEEQVSELCTGSVVASRKSNELSTVWVNDESADVSSDHRGTGSGGHTSKSMNRTSHPPPPSASLRRTCKEAQ